MAGGAGDWKSVVYVPLHVSRKHVKRNLVQGQLTCRVEFGKEVFAKDYRCVGQLGKEGRRGRRGRDFCLRSQVLRVESSDGGLQLKRTMLTTTRSSFGLEAESALGQRRVRQRRQKEENKRKDCTKLREANDTNRKRKGM